LPLPLPAPASRWGLLSSVGMARASARTCTALPLDFPTNLCYSLLWQRQRICPLGYPLHSVRISLSFRGVAPVGDSGWQPQVGEGGSRDEDEGFILVQTLAGMHVVFPVPDGARARPGSGDRGARGHTRHRRMGSSPWTPRSRSEGRPLPLLNPGSGSMW